MNKSHEELLEKWITCLEVLGYLAEFSWDMDEAVGKASFVHVTIRDPNGNLFSDCPHVLYEDLDEYMENELLEIAKETH
jgi:hypothetical protein